MDVVKRQTVLGGPGRVVEFDESCFTKKKKYGRGSGGPQDHRWVFGMVERDHNGVKGRCLLFLVDNRQRETLWPIIHNHIHPDTRIISDNYSVYHQLGPSRGWNHDMVNHSAQFVDGDDPTIHTQTIEGT